MRLGDMERAERILGIMDDVYYTLITFDYPDAVTQGLRRQTDMVRGVLERTRGDLTLLQEQRRLEEQQRKLQESIEMAAERLGNAQCDRKAERATEGSVYEGRLYLVGGIVRDRFLGATPDEDIDIVIEGDAAALAVFLHTADVAEHPPVTYPRFGTAMVSVGGCQSSWWARGRNHTPRTAASPLLSRHAPG